MQAVTFPTYFILVCDEANGLSCEGGVVYEVLCMSLMKNTSSAALPPIGLASSCNMACVHST
jgi:hypothetical protein